MLDVWSCLQNSYLQWYSSSAYPLSELILLTQVLELVTLDNLTFIFKKAKVWRFDWFVEHLKMSGWINLTSEAYYSFLWPPVLAQVNQE